MKKIPVLLLGICALGAFQVTHAQRKIESNLKAVEPGTSFQKIDSKNVRLRQSDNNVHLNNTNLQVNNDITRASESEVTSYLVTPGGLQYKYLQKGTDNAYTNKPGDIATIHVEYKIGDSLVFSTHRLNSEDEPVMEMIKPAAFRGDVNEGLLIMHPGDVVEFSYPADSLSMHSKSQLPSYVKSGDLASWKITMYSVQSKEDFQKSLEEKQAAQKSIDDKIISEYLKKNNIKAEKTASGLYIHYHDNGSGAFPQKGQTVSVNYTGKFITGEVFDSNTDPQFNHVEPIHVKANTGQVIKGWDEAMMVMKKQSRATIYIPSHLAYGSNARPGIPANSVLIFEMEILDIK